MECPVCKERMKHERVDEVWVDICTEHGVWLDKGELDSLMEMSKKRGESEGFVKRLWSHSGSSF